MTRLYGPDVKESNQAKPLHRDRRLNIAGGVGGRTSMFTPKTGSYACAPELPLGKLLQAASSAKPLAKPVVRSHAVAPLLEVGCFRFTEDTRFFLKSFCHVIISQFERRKQASKHALVFLALHNEIGWWHQQWHPLEKEKEAGDRHELATSRNSSSQLRARRAAFERSEAVSRDVSGLIPYVNRKAANLPESRLPFQRGLLW